MCNVDRFLYFVIMLTIVLVSPACSKKKKISCTYQSEAGTVICGDQSENYEPLFHKAEEIILDLTDIPVPFYETKKVINRSENGSADGFEYLIKGTRDEIVQFYQNHLDMMGWQLMQQFIGSDESLLVFEMPFRSCAVFLHREKDDEYMVTVLSKNNEQIKHVDLLI